MALTPEENAAFYYGNPPAKTDYLSYLNPANYNVFATRNPAYEGLLGQDQAQALSRQSNVAGLLGAAAALAQGMGRGGPKRSAIQNIIGALGAGYGASGQQYQQGLQNFSTIQQLKANEDKQKAFADAAAKYPDLAPLARIDPAKFVEMVSQLEQQRPIADAYKQAYGQQPAQQAVPPISQDQIKYKQDVAKYGQDVSQYDQSLSKYKDQMSQMLGVAGPAADGGVAGVSPNVIPGTAPVREPTAPMAGAVEMYPVDLGQGYNAGVPAAPVAPVAPTALVVQPTPQVNTQEQALRNQKEVLLRVNSNLSKIGTKAANDEVKNNLEQIKNLNTEIQQVAVAGIDLSEFKNSLPENFRGQVDNLDKLVKKGIISGNDVRIGMQQIADKAADYQQKLTDYTNDVRRTAKELYPVTPLDELNQDQMRRLNLVIEQRAKARGAAGATRLNVGDKVLAGERAKSQSKAEDNAINALNAASDVRAIVDVLKPYRGGALQDLAGSVGAYLPGTKLEQLATAKQVAESIRAKLAPSLRIEGSGSTSDKDLSIFLSAIPSLFNTAEGRELIATYSDKLAARSAAAADIRAQLIENGTFTIRGFQQELQKAGLITVFTPEDLQRLNAAKPSQTPGSSLPSDVKRRYGLQ